MEIPKHYDIEELHIPIHLERSRRKTLSVSVDDSAELVVKAPCRMSNQRIWRFLEQRRYWIYKQVKRQQERMRNRVVRSEEEIAELKELARQVLSQKSEFYANLLQVEYKRLRIGDQKTRWGSCSAKGTVSYNWHLVLMPERIQDYVVVHELSHLREMNHSDRFWALVEEQIEDYRERRKWLKVHGDEYL